MAQLGRRDDVIELDDAERALPGRRVAVTQQAHRPAPPQLGPGLRLGLAPGLAGGLALGLALGLLEPALALRARARARAAAGRRRRGAPRRATDGSADGDGDTWEHWTGGSGSVVSPNCWKNVRIWAVSNVSRRRTRSQSSAAKRVFMSSNRATMGPTTPAGILQTGLAGNVAGLTKSASFCEGRVVRAAAGAAVQDDEAAVLEVVDPALRLGRVIGPVEAGRDRPEAGRVHVEARCRRAVRVASGTGPG